LPEIQPFAGIRYNPDRISDFSRVVAPPYDVIDPSYHSELLDRDPLNVVRLILGSSPGLPGDYNLSAALMAQWLEDDILIRDPEPRYYIIQDTYRLIGNEEPALRWGIIGRVRLEPFESGRIFPHERTHSRPKEDRLRLMRAFGGNLSQVLALFDGDATCVRDMIDPVFTCVPAVDLIDSEGIGRQLWVVEDRDIIQGVSDLLAGRNLYIADGHHRYETALTYSREKIAADPSPSPDKGYNFVMMALVGMKDPGLTIFPIHRLFSGLDNFQFDSVIARLEKTFSIEPLPFNRSGLMLSGPTQSNLGGRGFVLYDPSEGRFFKALLREGVDLALRMPGISAPVRRLEVTLVEKFLMMECLGMKEDQISRQEHLEYFQDLESATAKADEYGQLLVIMPPTSLDDLVDVTGGRERMPQKSTFFFPKLLSGLVFYSHGHSI
jgi:uncharacterized protein (DUF1015 family)